MYQVLFSVSKSMLQKSLADAVLVKELTILSVKNEIVLHLFSLTRSDVIMITPKFITAKETV